MTRIINVEEFYKELVELLTFKVKYAHEYRVI